MKDIQQIRNSQVKAMSGIEFIRNRLLFYIFGCVIGLCLLISATSAIAGGVTYYHVNHQGTPIAATDESGAEIWNQYSSIYGYHDGTSSQLAGGALLSFGLGGHVEDQVGDRRLVYMGARHYDPVLGRFLSIDPVEFSVRNPQSFNRYAYGNNNPNRYVDPDGRLPLETFWDIANIGLGLTSFGANAISGNFAGAALDLGGVLVDTAAAIVPYVPGGAGTAIKANRIADRLGDVPNSGLPDAADAIDPEKIREIERRVRSGETSFPLDTGAQLRAVAESFKSKAQLRVEKGNLDSAKNIVRAGNDAIDRLDRFGALTPAARQQLRDIVNSGVNR